jgi:hypothetical protein
MHRRATVFKRRFGGLFWFPGKAGGIQLAKPGKTQLPKDHHVCVNAAKNGQQ